MKVFILAAGLGSRLKPFTNHCPKALVPLQGQPLLYHLLQRLKQQGFEDIVLNIHHYGQQIVNYLIENQMFGLNISISDERDQLLDTGGALVKALPLLGTQTEVLVHNVDVLTSMDYQSFVQTHYASKAEATLAVRARQTQRLLLFDENQRLQAWKNTQTQEYIGKQMPNLHPWAFSGIHIIQTSLIQEFADEYSAQSSGKEAHSPKFSVISAYIQNAENHKIMAYPHDTDYWLDLGKPEQLAQANSEFL
ncbi:MAG: nucleotidyltransferase family protein [Bacteroidales bacterium]